MDQLTAYIKENLSKGVSRESITSYLLSLDWQAKDIETAFSQLAAGQGQPQVNQQQSGAVQPPTKKPFLNLKIIIVLIAAILLIAGSSGYYFLFYQKKTEPNPTNQASDAQKNSESPAPIVVASPTATAVIEQQATSSTSKNYAACFSKYDKKFMPEIIGDYKKYKIFQDSPAPTTNADGTKVNWQIDVMYKKADDHTAVTVSVGDDTDLKMSGLMKPRVVDPISIDGLEMFQAVLEDNGRPSEKGSSLVSFIPQTKVYILFWFEPPAADANEIFASWLKQACG